MNGSLTEGGTGSEVKETNERKMVLSEKKKEQPQPSVDISDDWSLGSPDCERVRASQ